MSSASDDSSSDYQQQPQQFAQLTSDFIDNSNKIYKTKGTFIQLLKNNQAIDLLNAHHFDLPASSASSAHLIKKVEFSDLPPNIQVIVNNANNNASSQSKKKTRSVTTLFSKFRTKKNNATTTTPNNNNNTTTASNSSGSLSNTPISLIQKNNNSTNSSGSGSSTSLLDNTNTSHSGSGSGGSHHQQQQLHHTTIHLNSDEDHISNEDNNSTSTSCDSDEDDIILKDRTLSFNNTPTTNNNNNNNTTTPFTNNNGGTNNNNTSSSSSSRLNNLNNLPSMELPSLDLPSFDTSTSATHNTPIVLSENVKNLLSTKLLKYFHKKQFKEYISKSPQVRTARLRRGALLEILSTEQSYYNSLQICKSLFMDVLLSEAQTKKKAILSQNDIQDIFGELPSIMQASDILISDLKKEIDKSDPEHPILIGKIFKSFAPFLRLYSRYINNFDSIAERVEKLEKTSKVFAQFLAKTHELPECCGLTLLSYLVCPVQRVPRIRMLLQEVLRRTDETHVDYQSLESALQIVNQVAENLNESKRTSENDKIVFELQERISKASLRFNNLFQPHRKFIACFNNVHVESSKEIEKKRYYAFYNLYLFNDMLLIVPSFQGNSKDGNSDEEENSKIARESLAIYLAFTKLKDLEDQTITNSSISQKLSQIVNFGTNSHHQQQIGKFSITLNTFIKTQNVSLTFSFTAQIQRDELESEIAMLIDKVETKNEKILHQLQFNNGNSKKKNAIIKNIESKRMEQVKQLKSNDMILSKNLLQKHVNSEKLRELSDRLIPCELELQVKLQYYRQLKEEFNQQLDRLGETSQKEAESLIEYEEQVQKMMKIDDLLFKMLNQDTDAFREVFMDEPKHLIDMLNDNNIGSNGGEGGAIGGAIGNSLMIGSSNEINSLPPLTSGTTSTTTTSSTTSTTTSTTTTTTTDSSGSGSGSSLTRGTLSMGGASDDYDNFNSGAGAGRKQTIMPKKQMFTSGGALSFGLLDGFSSHNSSRDSTLPLKQLKDTCNPYIQQAYRELRRKSNNALQPITTTTTNGTTTNNSTTNNTTSAQSDESDDEVEVFNTLYRIRPNRKWFMMEPIKRLPNKYSIDRVLHGESTPQDICPKIFPYPSEYSDLDLYYDKISHRDGFYNEEEEEMFSSPINEDADDGDEFKSYNRNYQNYFDLPSNVDELRTMIIKLQFEREDLRSDVNKLNKQLTQLQSSQQSNANNNNNSTGNTGSSGSTPSTPFSALSSGTTMAEQQQAAFNSPPPLVTSPITITSSSTTTTSTSKQQQTQQQQPQPVVEYIASDFIEDYIE